MKARKIATTFLVTTLTLFAPLSALAECSKPDKLTQKPSSYSLVQKQDLCFQQKSIKGAKSFQIEENLTQEDKELFMRIRASQEVINSMRIERSIANTVQKCLQKSNSKINGFYEVKSGKDTKPSIYSTREFTPRFKKVSLIQRNGKETNIVNTAWNRTLIVTFSP
ncbi:MAG: hypothetical protein ACRCXZ_02225, partial [Patescibacteria group bacterium]